MKEFLNPKSMLTPGVAGSLMMFLVNGISYQFPEIPARYLALILSFLIGAIVWFSGSRGKTPVAQTAVYWVLNSLVIFVVGFGTANLAADTKSETAHALLPSFVSTAFAQTGTTQCPQSPASTQRRASGAQNVKTLEEKLAAEKAQNAKLQKQVDTLQQQKGATKSQDREGKFFKRW